MLRPEAISRDQQKSADAATSRTSCAISLQPQCSHALIAEGLKSQAHDEDSLQTYLNLSVTKHSGPYTHGSRVEGYNSQCLGGCKPWSPFLGLFERCFWRGLQLVSRRLGPQVPRTTLGPKPQHKALPRPPTYRLLEPKYPPFRPLDPK